MGTNKAKKAEAQRQQLKKWGHLLHGLCPILPEDCVISGHGNPTCLKHPSPKDWTVAQATAFRDVVLPNVPQVRTGFTRDEIDTVTELVSNVILRKQGCLESPVHASIAQRDAMSAGQQWLIWNLQSAADEARTHSSKPGPEHTQLSAGERALQAKLKQAQQQAAASAKEVNQLTADADALRVRARQHAATEQTLRDQLRASQTDAASLRAQLQRLQRQQQSAAPPPPPLPSHANNAAAVSAELRALQLGLAALVPVAHQIPADTLAATTACLSAGAPVVQKFLAGLKQCGLTLADVTRRGGGQQPRDLVVAFHGTADAGSIMCHGFDPAKRSGQQYGAGEYFAEDWATASQYALRHTPANHHQAYYQSATRNAPSVVVTLLIKAKANQVRQSWYVVENAVDGASTFCLPVAALSADPSLGRHGSWQLAPCSACAVPATGSTRAPSTSVPARGVDFRDEYGAWAPMNAVDAAKVVAARVSSAVVRNVFSRKNFTYDVDYGRMVQINTSTRVERDIRFATA